MAENFKNYIAGEWCDSPQTIENRNPSDISDLIGNFAQASGDQLDDAITSAAAAQRIWAHYGLERKQAVLMAIGTELMARATELGTLLSREEGKPLAEGRGEVYRAGQFFTYYAAEVLRQLGQTAESVRAGVDVQVYREPVGVVAVISPWNFPTATASWKIAPALAYGNAVIWKPANLTPASAHALTEIISRQDIPKGLFNLVMGAGGTVGQALVEDPRVNAISFTGSVPVGQGIARSAVGNFTKLQMEMGSKNALVVMDDADLDLAAKTLAFAKFRNAGQVCVSPTRFLVQEELYDGFVEKFVAFAKTLKVGDGMAADTTMGPLAHDRRVPWVEMMVQDAQSKGGKVHTGGKRIGNKGYFYEPTVMTDVPKDARAMNEEPFGPMAMISRFKDLDEVVEEANRLPYGLASYAFTRSAKTANAVAARVESGMMTINHLGLALPEVPFGGIKDSGYGSEGGLEAIEAYLNTKFVSQAGL